MNSHQTINGADTKSELDFAAAREFLQLLDPEADQFIFCFFPDPAELRNKLKPITRFGNLISVWPEIERRQAQRYGVFVTVNEMKGVRRVKDEIKRPRAVWRDRDAPAPPLPQTPSMRIQTSMGKEQEYFLIDPNDPLTPAEAELVNTVIAQEFKGDPNAKDLARVLRLPGTFHHKNAPQMVKIIMADGRRYTRGELLAAFPVRPTSLSDLASPRRQTATGLQSFLEPLQMISPDDYGTWIKVGMALHFESSGQTDGLNLWDDWSKASEKYEIGVCAERWKTFGVTSSGITGRTIVHLAQGQLHLNQVPQKNADLRVIDPKSWHGKPVPEREWLIDGMIPAGTVTAIYGDGAAGKSTLCLQLAVARALNKTWLGFETKAGRTLYLSAEDDTAELHRRVNSIREHYQASFRDLGDLLLADLVGLDAAFATHERNGEFRPTEFYRIVRNHAKLTRPSLIIIDSLADFFAGNEIDRQHARQFIGLLKKMCIECELTVVLIAHPSVSGMQSGDGSSGSTAWSNSVRSRLYFQTVPNDSDARVLIMKKANYAKMGEKIEMRWVNGIFAVQNADDIASAKENDNIAAQQKFIELLRSHNEQGINVSANNSPSSAPSVFSRHVKRGGFTRTNFRTAMQLLLEDKTIKQITEGPPSKRRSRLVITSEYRA